MNDILISRILIVEDHADSALMLTRLLKRTGYEVRMAGKVVEALDIAREVKKSGDRFDLVVSDLGLPDGTGYDLMRTLHDEYQLPGIALSGYGQVEDIRRALASGFSYHLTKPIDFEKLKQTIQQVLDTAGRSAANN